MYIFTNFFPYSISRVQFLGGLVIGAFSSIPLVFHDSFFLGELLGNIFLSLSAQWLSGLIINFSLLFVIITGIYFVLGYFFQGNKKRYISVYLLSISTILFLVIFSALIMLLFQKVLPGSIEGLEVGYGGMVSFLSVGSIISYYIVIALLEEGNKYISGLSFSGRGEYFLVFQKYLPMTACIALGFAFFENILYSYFYIMSSGINTSLISLVFFRSVFTIILHLMSSLLFALGLWSLLQIPPGRVQRSAFTAFTLCCLGLMSHVIFDSVLSFGYIGVLLFYIFFQYILLSYIAMKMNSLPDSSGFQ